MATYIKKQKEESLKFSLDTNGIEVKALAKILHETHVTAKEIAKSTGQPEPDLKVYPFKQGSFEYNLVLDAIKPTGLAIVGALAAIKTILDIKKSCIENRDRKSKTTLQKVDEKEEYIKELLKSNTALNSSVNILLKTVLENSNGFTVTGTDGKSTSFNRNEIRDILGSEAVAIGLEKEETKTIIKNETLFFVKKSNAKYGMWQFIYDDIKIMADLDKHLKDYYKDRITSGARVDARIKIWQKFNVLARAWENKKYRIVEITRVEK